MPTAKKNSIRSSEGDNQNAIMDYLALKRHFFWRNNTVGVYDPKRETFRSLPKYSMSGLPDIIVVKDGFFVGLEVKRHGTKQSPNQKVFEEKVKLAGGEYYVVRDIEDLINIGL